MKKFISITIAVIVVLGIIVGLAYLLYRCDQNPPEIYTGSNPNRIVTVYSCNGDAIATYKGRFNIQFTTSNKVIFIIDGRRYVYCNALVEVIEENDDE